MTFPDFDMALLGPNGFVAGWADPGTDIKADVQAMMAKWERDALVLGIEVDWPHDLVTALTRLLVPEPVRGGTYLYCPWRKKVPDGIMACGVLRPGWATGTRFRTTRAYRRHWRRHHLGDL